MMKAGLAMRIWVIGMNFILPGYGLAQADINIKAGIETWAFSDERNLFGDSRHPGQTFGVDVLVKKGRGIFVPGFHYHRFTVENEARSFEFNFRDPRHLHYFTIPLLFGYTITDGSACGISVIGGPEVQFFYDVDQNFAGLDDDMLHGVSTALSAGVVSEWFSLFIIELRYHHGLQPLVRQRTESRTRGLTIAAGIAF